MVLVARICLITTILCLGACSVPERVGETPCMALQPPISTEGAKLIDASGCYFKLFSVNWFGAESPEYVVGGLHKQSIGDIVDLIERGGFNSVRLPWSNEMFAQNPIVESQFVAANPEWKNRSALEIFDAVIAEITARGMFVVLDNHRSRADWCCDEEHGDGLWYSLAYPESMWLEHWTQMVLRYKDNPYVIAAELRNELRPDPGLGLIPSWGEGESNTDWHGAATRAGNALLEVNPALLIIVGGLEYQEHLRQAESQPIKLRFDNKLVYAAHDYVWWHSEQELSDPKAFAENARKRWEFLVSQRNDLEGELAPVYISEWGGCTQSQEESPCGEDRRQFLGAMMRYLCEVEISWAYWPLNGTQSLGYGREHNQMEGYGLLVPNWDGYANPEFMALMRACMH